jgi:hypothetical protein
MITNMSFVWVSFICATRRFVEENTDKIQALFGVLDSARYGINRKVVAIADILGISPEDVPTVPNRQLGIHAKMTEQEIRRHLAVALRPSWRRETESAHWIRVRRSQLREREALDWLRLPLAERTRLKRASRAANGTICTVPSAPRAAWVWKELQRAKSSLLGLG